MTLVLDASAALELVLVTPRGRRVMEALEQQDLVAPELVDAECASALARLERAGQVTPEEADRAVRDFRRLPFARVSHLFLTERAWALRDRVRVADAFYVACSELVRAPLLTCDRRLAAAALPGVPVLLVQD